MADVVMNPAKGSSIEKRIADRLRPSNHLAEADAHTVHGTGPTRTHTTIHHSGSAKKHGSDKQGDK
jgi:hypothetical protein